MSIRYTAWGAAGEVTGSKHLFDVDGQHLLLDCGAFQGKRFESRERNLQFPIDPDRVADVVLSHAHFDHCGNLPTLVGKGYRGNIYATGATRDIANLVLMDSAHLQAQDAKWMRKKMPGHRVAEPLYGVDEVLATNNAMVTFGYHRPLRLAGGVTAEFLEAGHILGSAQVLLHVPGPNGTELRILYTGDIGRCGMPIIRDPDPFPEVDYIFCEGTYGNRLHDPIDDARHQLAEVIRSTFDKGGKVIIPAFAVERTQELIYFLHLLRDEKKIPQADIFVDSPMAVSATSIFRVHPECYNDQVHQQFLDHHKNPFGFEQVHYLVDAWESKQLNDRQMPCIIIAGSGMCEGGRILHHLRHTVSDPRCTILVVGYMAANTLGRRIADREPEVRIFGQPHPLRARVKILNTFSAHADYQDLQRYFHAASKKRLKGVFLVHGEDEALTNLQGLLQDAGCPDVRIPAEGETYDLG